MNNYEREILSIKKREQELYKFILEKFKTYEKTVHKSENNEKRINLIFEEMEKNERLRKEFNEKIENIKTELLEIKESEKNIEKNNEENDKENSERSNDGNENRYNEGDGNNNETRDSGSIRGTEEGNDEEFRNIDKGGNEEENSCNSDRVLIIKEDLKLNFNNKKIICKNEKNIKILLPELNNDYLGEEILILNTNGFNVKITTENGIKIGGQYEKNLKNKGQFIRLIGDNESYYVI